MAGCHTTTAPAGLIYSSVVSCDSARIALTIDALNDIEVMACNIKNTYLTKNYREKIWTIAGPEFVSESRQPMIVVRELYGIKSSGAAFWALLAETLNDLGYNPSFADQDVWIRAAVKPCIFKYYDLILCYVHDVLTVSHDTMKTMNVIRSNFTLKDDKFEKPNIYLGASLDKMPTADGVECWTMLPEKYCKADVQNVKKVLKNHGQRLPSKCRAPLKPGYRP